MTSSHPTALLACALALSAAAAAAAAPKGKDAPPSIASFARLSGARAGPCGAPPDPRLAALGQPSLRQCAWSQHLELQVWRALPPPADACLPPAASAWHRLAATAQSSPAPWNAAWPAQSLVTAGAIQQALALWRNPDGAWSAALWRWQPADRPATRAWQQAHWQDVVQAARTLGAPVANPTPLQQAWEDATGGKPRVLDGDSWRWVAQNSCLGLRTAGIGQAQLHLPWSRDDARLEQRSGMQVQLARRFPDAEWLQPFTLLEPTLPGTRTGAKFVAVWRQASKIEGQLWIPLREDGGIVRARIGTDLRGDAARHQAELVEHELTALAHAWEVRHE